jgi:AcrR family transcriptional regulator
MEKKKLSKRKIQAAETKKKIYETAKQLVVEYGIGNVSVDSIVKAAEVSKGTFYVHFESKDSLVADLINDYTNIADMDYKSFLMTVSDRDSVLDILVLLADKISDFIQSNIGVENMKVLYKGHLTKTINTAYAMDYNRELYKLFTEVLKRGVDQGELREDIPVDSLTKHLILGIRGVTFEWCIRYPDFILKDQVHDHFKILLDGLKK